MSDASSLLHRIRYTPMRDVVRARFTGRLDWLSRVNRPDLPVPAVKLIVRVVKRTRLLSLEKVQVANELIAHFADGVASGASIDELMTRFGDERQVARLIARAKRRNRPIAWHVLRALTMIAVTLILVYVGLTVRFFVGKPAPSVNYLTIADAPTLARPSNERAWPIYRAALAKVFPAGKADVDANARFINAETKTKNWDDALIWVRSHRGAISQFHRAARLPILGYVYESANIDPDLRPIYWIDRSMWPDQTSLMMVNVPSSDLHLVCMLLLLDGWDRVEQNDPMAMQDVESLLRLADQNQAEPLGAAYSSAYFRSEALNLIEFALTEHANLWTDAQLTVLAHELARPRVSADLINLQSQRLYFYDTIQRIYTDDGAGDGRVTPDAGRYLNVAPQLRIWLPERRDTNNYLAGATSLRIASRKEVLREFDAIMNQLQSDYQQPARALNQSSAHARLVQLLADPSLRMKYLPITSIVPTSTSAQGAERYLGRRDGIEVGIALELYRRKHQKYPDALSELVPGYLPEVPVDRIAGEPIHYAIANGQPIVYSVGVDRDDDGGRPPRNRSGALEPWSAAAWSAGATSPTSRIPDGDWVLYPDPDPRQ